MRAKLLSWLPSILCDKVETVVINLTVPQRFCCVFHGMQQITLKWLLVSLNVEKNPVWQSSPITTKHLFSSSCMKRKPLTLRCVQCKKWDSYRCIRAFSYQWIALGALLKLPIMLGIGLAEKCEILTDLDILEQVLYLCVPF